MRRAISSLGLALFAFACAPGQEYSGLEFDPQSSPPDPVSFESDRIEIPAGIAVKVAVKPLSHGEDYDSHDTLSLRADDEELLGVYATENSRQFVFVGLRAGRTCLAVRINRKDKECIDVRVLAPE